jgi:hypothetical protein
MMRALIKSHSFLKDNKAEAVRMISDWLKMEPAVATVSYEIYLNALSPDGFVSERALMLDIARTREALKIKEEVPLSKVVDFTLLKETQNAGRSSGR